MAQARGQECPRHTFGGVVHGRGQECPRYTGDLEGGSLGDEPG
jgi:hypothetical protein